MLQALSPLDGRYAARFSKIVALLLALSSVARADLVGHHAGANQLLLSGDGKVAFTGDYAKTRVWDVEGKRELAMLPSRALAVSGDGGRVFCQESGGIRARTGAEFAFWGRKNGVWQKGTRVSGKADEALLDARFEGDELLILWELSVERRDASGRVKRATRLKGLSKFPFTYAEPGAISPDGTRVIAPGYFKNADETSATIFDVATGQPLRKTLRSFGIGGMDYRSRWTFSPRNELVGTIWGDPVTPWNPADGDQPVEWTRVIWNTRKSASALEDYKYGINPLSASYDLSLTFWPGGKRPWLTQLSPKAPWKLEIFDASSESPTEKKVPLPFTQSWGKPLREWRFSRDGQTMVALDESGDIWAEQVRPN